MNDTNRHARPHHRRPPLAPLAAAILLVGSAQAATITVDEAGDDDPGTDNGACSLREAVISANTNAPVDACAAGQAGPGVVDEIRFDASLDGTIIDLAIAGITEDAAATGDLDLADDVIIRGNGGVHPALFSGTPDAATVVDANGIDRVFHVPAAVTVVLEDLAFGGGEAPQIGGGLATAADSSVTLRNVLVTENTAAPSAAGAPATGGAIFAQGDLVLERTAVVSNRAQATGSGSVSGGGITASAALTLDGVAFAENIAGSEGAPAQGGALAWAGGSGAELVADDVLFINNGAVSTGEIARGGAVLIGVGTAALRNTAVVENIARGGSGGGHAHGGGIHVEDIGGSPTLDVINVTFSGNDVETDGGDALGGAILVEDGDVTLSHVTLTANEASTATGFALAGGVAVSSASVTLAHTILADNTDVEGAPDCYGTVDSAGYNLLGNNLGCTLASTTGDQVGDVAGGDSAIDPMLDAFADNGGGFTVGVEPMPQITHAPQDASPVIDAGNSNPVAEGTPPACEPTDQRDGQRPADGDGDGAAVCDIGAYERNASFASSGGGGGGGGGAGGPALILLLALGIAGACIGRAGEAPAA